MKAAVEATLHFPSIFLLPSFADSLGSSKLCVHSSRSTCQRHQSLQASENLEWEACTFACSSSSFILVSRLLLWSTVLALPLCMVLKNLFQALCMEDTLPTCCEQKAEARQCPFSFLCAKSEEVFAMMYDVGTGQQRC